MSAAAKKLNLAKEDTMLPPERVASVAGFGMRSSAAGYLYRPSTVDELRDIFDLARRSNRQITLRGAGRSYGDANIGAECIIVDCTRMNRILGWDRRTGLIDCDAGVTIEMLWRHILEDGYWPPVVSGTMFPTIAGALAMNIHGKNNFAVGTLGEHVVDLDVLLPSGKLLTLTPKDELFYAVISSFGSLGIITRAKLRMKPIHSGELRVLPISCANWDEQLHAFEELESNADYMVSWIDCFAKGAKSGRGLFHAAWYADEGSEFPVTLREENQDLPDTILGLMPKSMVWRVLKMFATRPGMLTLNSMKHLASRMLGHGKPHPQSLVGFSFLLDYVPNWRWAYAPNGFIQYQSFVPKEHAQRVFARQLEMQHEAEIVSFLGVMKRHRPDRFLFSHAVDGYSLALDFRVQKGQWHKVQGLCHRMNDLVLEAGGRFYFAKDSTLRPQDVRAYMGEEALGKYRRFKHEMDPEALLTSELSRRLELG